MYCSNCGREIDENSNFCSYCGQKLPENENTSVKHEDNVHQAQQTDNQQTSDQQSDNQQTSYDNVNETDSEKTANQQANSNQQAYSNQQSASSQQSYDNQHQNNNFNQNSFNSFNLNDKKPLNNNSWELALRVFGVIFAVIFAWQCGTALFSMFKTLDFSFYVFRYYPVFILNIPIAIASAFIYFISAIILFLISFQRTEKNSSALFLSLTISNFLIVVMLFVRQIFNFMFFRNVSDVILFGLILPIICTAGIFFILYSMGQAPLISSLSTNTKETVESCINELCNSFKNFISRFNSSSQNFQDNNQNYQSNNTGFNQNSNQSFDNQSQNQNNFSSGNAYSANVYAPVKQDRSLIIYIILNVITCGIYGFYFIYSVARDVNRICYGDSRKTTGLIGFILLNIITCGLYSFYWYYALGNRLADAAPRYSMYFREDGTTVLLWMVLGSLLCGIGFFVGLYFIMKNLNALSAAYNNRNF